MLSFFTSAYTGTRRVTGIGKNGQLTLVLRQAATQTSTIADGVTKKGTAPGVAALFTVSPRNEVVRAVPLPNAPVGKSKYPARKSLVFSKAKTENLLRRAYEAFNPARFPDKPLRVGDTWKGVPPQNPYQARSIKDYAYTATLLALETHRGVPCAKVENAVSGEASDVKESIEKQLPSGAQLDGKSVLSGTITAYYSLDRGLTLDETVALQIEIKYHLKGVFDGRAIETDLDGTASFETEETAVTFPPYDASLIPAPASPTG